jgi:ParB-like chromosome segregation protein Spo0J
MSVVAIDQVCVHANRRPLNDQKVAELMQSIKANGLLNPITLDQHCTLIAGLHRLTACKLLGFVEIECHVVTCEDADQARLAEIDENLIRNELEALDSPAEGVKRIHDLPKLPSNWLRKLATPSARFNWESKLPEILPQR